MGIFDLEPGSQVAPIPVSKDDDRRVTGQSVLDVAREGSISLD